MSKLLTAILKGKLEDLAAYSGLDAETLRNTLKEELQYYVLNFIYHHPEYNSWVMYGGSALRIIHGLDRMSVDLDFEISHAVTAKFLEELKKDIEEHFRNTYGTNADFLAMKVTNGRGLTLKFNVGENLSFGHSSKQVHVKIDLNHFVAPKTVTERRLINRDQLSFVLVTYNMASLMASKIAAIFLRGTRGIGKEIYEEKGRDIYDLLWYMGKKAVPDFDYLIAKRIDVKNPRALFDKLTITMNKVSDKNLKQDLEPLFVNKSYIGNWLKNWRESYLQLLGDYKIRTIREFEHVAIHEDFNAGIFSFVYWYTAEDGDSVRIIYRMSDHCMNSREGDLGIEIDKKLEGKIEFNIHERNRRSIFEKKLVQYATLFFQKTENYFKKMNGSMLGESMVTKVIRMAADNLNQKEQILLNRSALMACEFDDLLK